MQRRRNTHDTYTATKTEEASEAYENKGCVGIDLCFHKFFKLLFFCFFVFLNF
jgi:hypothetical protein